jgi:hypothetical protein
MPVQRLCEILGFRLKGADYLQLRVALRASDNGVCLATLDEHPDHIGVRVLACLTTDEERLKRAARDRHETDCPLNAWLDAPLGERVVIDLDTGDELWLYIPRWDPDEPSEYVARAPGNLWPPATSYRWLQQACTASRYTNCLSGSGPGPRIVLRLIAGGTRWSMGEG